MIPPVVGEPDIDDGDNATLDSDCDGISDEQEFGTLWPGETTTDPALFDTDGDGIPDGVEAGETVVVDARCPVTTLDLDPATHTNPTLKDSDGDCLDDNFEDLNRNGRLDPTETDPTAADGDDDGLSDGEELGCNALAGNGGGSATDPNDADSDGDGLSDGLEVEIGTDPNDNDSDNDGVNDGDELENGTDPTGGSLPDEDGDGIADEDEIANGTDPALTDTDGDGLDDNDEDLNGDGVIDPGETDPRSADADCDGLNDFDELAVGSDGLDFDSDGDSLGDGFERGKVAFADINCTGTLIVDTNPLTVTDPTKRDTDGDGLNDGVEDFDRHGAVGAANPGGRQETEPTDPDSDDDGLCDGNRAVVNVCAVGEDLNGDNFASGTETDPRVPNTDTDGDGIPDVKETVHGTSSTNPDTDGDGLCDGGLVVGTCTGGEDLNGNGRLDPGETSPKETDTDCDGVGDGEERALGTDPNRVDSDGDGIRDGVELGKTAVVGAPSTCANVVLDADPAVRTNSNPLRSDSDGDGIPDGLEDRNRDGAIAAGGTPRETFPNDGDSDGDGLCDGPRAIAACVAGEDNNGNGLLDPGETNPRVGDFDNDGDGLRGALDPDDTTADTDGDGLCDGAIAVGACIAGEDMNKNGVVDTGETSARKADTDCDALNDREERALGTNALLTDTDGDLVTDGVELGRTARLDCATAPLDLDPTIKTNPLVRDTDGDGLNDGVEDSNRDGAVGAANRNGQETNPANPDMDGDGKCDGPASIGACLAGEDLNRNSRVDGNETDPRVADVDTDGDGLTNPDELALGTDPTRADTDGDGLTDGREVRTTNTDPLSVDTDCDGRNDGAEVNGTPPTDPLRADTDGDGLSDGLETGTTCSLVTVPAQTTQACLARCRVDADPTTTTNPGNVDSDGDGIDDGAEDANQNGKVDPGELNPNLGTDVGGADQAACAVQNLRQITLVTRADATADLILAVPQAPFAAANAQITTVLRAGATHGAMVFDPATQTAGVAVKLLPGALGTGDITAQLTQLETTLSAQGTRTSSATQTFTTWDGELGAIGRYTYTDNGNDRVRKALNDIVLARLPTATDLLTPAGGDDLGAYTLQVELIRRSDASTVLVMALTQTARVTSSDQALFRLDDLANGSSVAQFGDDTGTQCDRFVVQPAQKVDFIVVLDNSGSMNNELNAVATAASEIGAQLSASTVDFRLSVLSSDVDNIANTAAAWNGEGSNGVANPRYCEFTSNVATFQTCVSAVGIGGSGGENFFRPFACLLGKALNGPGINTELLTITSVNIASIDDDGAGGTVIVNTSVAHGLRVGDRVTIGGVNGGTPAGTYNANYTIAEVISTSSVRTTEVDPNTDNDPVVSNRGTIARRDASLGGAVDGEACGRNQDRAPFSAAGTYLTPPDTFPMLPRALNDARKLRTNANTVVLFVTDAPEQSDGEYAGLPEGNTTAEQSVPTWVSFFSNFDDANTAGSKAFVAGIVCPAGSNCSDANTNGRFKKFFADMGGIEVALPADTDPAQAAKIRAGIRLILQQSIAQASPYVLTKPPISASIKVAFDSSVTTFGTCDKTDIPRSRTNGFDYDGVTNSLQFFGACRPTFDTPNLGRRITTSYKYWIEDSPDPDGNIDPCAACENPLICVNDQCLCPSDCGGGLADNETCDPITCTPQCLPDCGACNTGLTCDVGACQCLCDDCNGPPPGPGFVCQQDSCKYECTGCVGPRPGSFSVCNLATCEYDCDGCGNGEPLAGRVCNTNAQVCDFECLPDCGGCNGGAVCNQNTCGCECPADCGGAPPRASMTCNRNSCQFECPLPPAGSVSPGPNFVWDVTTCEYTCPDDCGGGVGAGPNAVCDASTCELRCPADCGGCDGAGVCNSASCACECPSDCGGVAPSANHVCDANSCGFVCRETPVTPPPHPGFVWNTTTCRYECPANCGAPGALASPEFCNRTTCEVQCLPNCGGCGFGETCNQAECACQCVENATCAPGFAWDSNACECACDTGIECGPTRVLNPDTCACECGDNCNDACGGATPLCQQSACDCRGIGG